MVMDADELRLLASLDKAVREDAIKQHMAGVIQRVQQTLEDNPQAMMSWEPIPLTLYKQELPAEIKSCWVFNLRKNKTIGGVNKCQRKAN